MLQWLEMETILQQLENSYLGLDRRLRGRVSLLVRTWLAFGRHDGAIMSTSIAYYGLFSLFPLILVLLSLAAPILVSPQALHQLVTIVESYIPTAAGLVEQNLMQLLKVQSTISILSLISLIWSAPGVFSTIFQGVNRAWGNPKPKLFLAQRLYSFGAMVVAGVFLLASVGVSALANVVQTWQIPVLGWEPFANSVVNRLLGLFLTVLPGLVSVAAFTLLYKTIPRTKVAWRDVWLGGLIAGVVWQALNEGFAWYLANFARYNVIYGSVGAVIAFLLWSYLSAMILLLGAEYTAESHRWRRAGSPLETRPLRQWLADYSN